MASKPNYQPNIDTDYLKGMNVETQKIGERHMLSINILQACGAEWPLSGAIDSILFFGNYAKGEIEKPITVESMLAKKPADLMKIPVQLRDALKNIYTKIAYKDLRDGKIEDATIHLFGAMDRTGNCEEQGEICQILSEIKTVSEIIKIADPYFEIIREEPIEVRWKDALKGARELDQRAAKARSA